MESSSENNPTNQPEEYKRILDSINEGSVKFVEQVYQRVFRSPKEANVLHFKLLAKYLTEATGIEFSDLVSTLSQYEGSKQVIFRQFKLENFIQSLRTFCQNQLRDYVSGSESEGYVSRNPFDFSTQIAVTQKSSSQSSQSSPKSIQELLDTQRGYIEYNLPNLHYADLAISLLQNLEIPIDEPSLPKLRQIFDSIKEPLEYDQFTKIIVDWHNKLASNEESQQSFQAENEVERQIKNSISQFEQLRQVAVLQNQETKQIDSVIRSLQSQLKKLKPQQSQNSQDNIALLNRCQEGVQKIFEYYAGQQRLLGRTPTFDEIEKNLHTWNEGKFLRFCRDFGIMESKGTVNRRAFTKKEMIKVFKKYAQFSREMSLQQFQQVLQILSLHFFNDAFDNIHGTQFKNLSPNEKTLRFYQHIGCHKPAIYQKALKGFGIPFSSYTDYRIPENDPARKYKYRPYDHQKNTSIQQWKQKQASQSLQPQLQSPKPPQKTVRLNRIKEREEDFFNASDLIVESSDDDIYINKQYPLNTKNTTKPFSTPQMKSSVSMKTLQRANELSYANRYQEAVLKRRAYQMLDERMQKGSKFRLNQ